jgi:ketosteroid isomerase-like protein
MLPRTFSIYLCGSLLVLGVSVAAQVPGTIPGQAPASPNPYKIVSPITQPTITPGQLTLLELEGKFAQAVAEGGGKAFASWFAEDAVTLNNGKPATLGRGAIAASATWDAKDYLLTWVAQGAQMGPSNDMGFTWGHYEGRSKDRNGNPIVTTGRYITIWRKLADGTWKVAMDASADEPPNAGDCCALPKP